MAACADATASRTAGVGVFAACVAVAGTGLIPFASVCFLNAAANPGTAAEAYGDRARVVPARAVAGRTRLRSAASAVGCFAEAADASLAAEALSRTTSAAAFAEGFVRGEGLRVSGAATVASDAPRFVLAASRASCSGFRDRCARGPAATDAASRVGAPGLRGAADAGR
jgi:hypothetical protein